MAGACWVVGGSNEGVVYDWASSTLATRSAPPPPHAHTHTLTLTLTHTHTHRYPRRARCTYSCWRVGRQGRPTGGAHLLRWCVCGVTWVHFRASVLTRAHTQPLMVLAKITPCTHGFPATSFLSLCCRPCPTFGPVRCCCVFLLLCALRAHTSRHARRYGHCFAEHWGNFERRSSSR